VTARPASDSRRAVPPVDSRRTPRAARARANSTMPVLSDTESRAVSIFMVGQRRWRKAVGTRRARSGLDVVRLELLAQRVAGDAQHFGRPGLVSAGPLEGHLEHRAFDAAHHHFPHVVGLGVAQVFEIALQAGAHAVFQDIFLAHVYRYL